MVMVTDLADVLRAAGLVVEEADGWKTRGRGEMTAVRGILIHHTGGARSGDRPSLGTVLNGRKADPAHGVTELAGPLSQLFLTRSGTWIVLAAGRCNHAGAGAWQGVTAGNANFLGVEAENSGVLADQWPFEQMDAYIRGCAAILDHFGLDDVMVAGHREYALPRGRKIDPLFDMVEFRAHVESAMLSLGGPGGKTRLPAITVTPVDPRRQMLRKGDQGKSVELLQAALNLWLVASGDKVTAPLRVDGGFGPTTQSMVEAFQESNGLLVDGKVGPATWKLLDA